jgi:hypothetical protein
MKRDLSINPPSVTPAYPLFVVVMALIVFAPVLYEGTGHCEPGLVPGVSNQGTFSDCNGAEQEEKLHPKSKSVTGNRPDEPSGIKSLSSFSETGQLSKQECISSSVHAIKKDCLYYPLIVRAANRHQVDPALIKAVIMAESRYNPNAISKKGAKGLMQLMPRTAKALGVEDGFNPEHNINAGVRYLKQLMNQFDGDIKLALAAYNAGSRTVKEFQGIPPIKATQVYIKKVLDYYRFYKRQMTGEIGRL